MGKDKYSQIRSFNLTFTISELINQIDSKLIDIDSENNNAFRWSNHKRSLFIDSIYQGFPIPSLFFYEEEFNNYTVVDGMQRLRTVYSYIKGDFRASQIDTDLNGKYFFELSDRDQRRILSGRFPVNVIAYMDNSQEIITEMFLRLNSGGEKLNYQELRNRMFSGLMNDKINELNEDELWRNLTNKLTDSRYRDAEVILKFFSYLEMHDRSIPVNENLNEFLLFNRNDVLLAEHFSSVFKSCINDIYYELGENALRVNGRFSRSLFDAFVIPLGIMYLKNKKNRNIMESYNFIYDLIIEGKLSDFKTNRKIQIGLDAMAGDFYEF